MTAKPSRTKPSILIVIPHYGRTNSLISEIQERKSEEYYDYPFPLGIPYIAAALTQAGYEYTPLNLNFADYPEKVFQEELQKHYDYVMTGGNSIIFKQIAWMVKLIRKISPDSKIILGGHIITTEPELMMTCMDFDYGAVGEGEVTIIRLLDALENNQPADSVRGIIFRNSAGEVIRTAPGEIEEDLEKLPFPELDAFGYRKWLEHTLSSTSYSYSYFDKPRPYVILGSRGCPFQCTFCFHDQKNRSRSLDNLFEEIKYAVDKYDINLIQVNDDCFSVKSERVYSFCDKMLELRRQFDRDIQWTVQLTVKQVTPAITT